MQHWRFRTKRRESSYSLTAGRELGAGRTYPQENLLSFEDFKAYFLSHRLVLGVFVSAQQLKTFNLTQTNEIPMTGIMLQAVNLKEIGLGTSVIKGLAARSSDVSTDPSIDWNNLVAFSYYIKPNYPGRSSHLCNGGFMVPHAMRGLGLGTIAGRSFLFYAPHAGYRGSVFNLVYRNNEASVRIWEQLGFQLIGTIPGAGRMKTADGTKEQYVDAQVVYGDFTKIAFRD